MSGRSSVKGKSPEGQMVVEFERVFRDALLDTFLYWFLFEC